MIDPIKAVGALKSVQLAGVERVRERIAEIEERFGIAGDNSFQSTLEREMRKAQKNSKAQAASGTKTKKSAEVGSVERAADAVGASNVKSIADAADKLRDAELVSEFANLKTEIKAWKNRWL